ncbi:MAG: hypothetical protein GY719_23855 [bacterium]|nr:hypothetical protein [bacterium]
MTDPTKRPVPEEVEALFRAKRAWHRQQARLPIKEKVRILLELQRQDLPLLARHRQLEWWERPWNIEP